MASSTHYSTVVPKTTFIEEPWRGAIRRRWGEGIYKDWFQTLRFLRIDDVSAFFSVHSHFIRDWIETHYMEGLRTILLAEFSECGHIVLEVDPLSGAEVSSSSPASLSESSPVGTLFSKEHDVENIPTIPLNPDMTFETFMVGKPNEFAYAAAQRVAESSESIYNPLFIYGPVGHGKTHLLHAIAHQLLQRSQGTKNVMYISAEKFMYYFIKSLRYKNVMAFKERFRSVDILLIDDVQFISGKESTQEEFFHTFNALVEEKRQLVISADKSPADLDGLQDRMRSRLGWGLVADLHPSTYELRLMVLQNKAKKLSVSCPPDVLEWLAGKITSNIRELEGALVRVAAHASLVGRDITIPMISDVLKDLVRAHTKELTIADIQKKIAEYYQIRVSDLSSAKRSRCFVRPRHIAMFLAKNLTPHSFPVIGKAFGGRDHTTVIHAINTVSILLERDKILREDVALLRQSLENV